MLAVVEHRRLVLLALADHDDAVHRDGVEHRAHRVDRGLVGSDLVAAADPAAGAHRRGLGDAHELEREVAVGAWLAIGLDPERSVRSRSGFDYDASGYIRSGASTPTRSRQRAITRCVARHELQAERLGGIAEHAALVVEAVVVVGQPDRVRRQQLRPAPLGCLAHRRREVGQALDQLLLLGGERAGRRAALLAPAGVAQDRGDPRVRVLHVVDGVLVGLLGRQIEVDVDRLVGTAVDEVPARGVDADLVEQLVEEHDVAGALRHLRGLAAAREVNELVEQHLDAVRVVAEHPRDRRVPVRGRVVVGAEHVDRAVVATLELVDEVRDVGGAVRRRAALLGRADEHPVLLVAVRGRARPERAVLLVRVEPRQQLGQALLERALQRPAVEVDAEALHRRLDRREHLGDRIAVALARAPRCSRRGSRPPAPARRAGPRRPSARKRSIWRAGVVVVVLALDLVAGELEQPRDRVAERAVARAETMIGPVGLAETISTCTRCAGSAKPPP